MNKVTLSSIVDIISGGTPKTSVTKYWKNGTIGWLSVTDFNNDVKYVYETEKKITEEGLKNSNTKLLNTDDIIISARGTVGALAQIGIPMCFNQSCFGLRGKKEIADNSFLYYCLKNYVSNIKKRSQGSVFETINLNSFDLMEIEIPEFNIQKKISYVLSSLDSKIELNNRINSELEAMAKTLYDYWFVQFDFPDENGKPYKTSGGKMVWNEELKREVPEGWGVENIQSCCSIIDCLHSKKPDCTFESDEFFLLQLENIMDNGLIDLSTKYFVSEKVYKDWTSRIEVTKDDLVITNAGRVGSSAQIPYNVKAGIGRNITAIRPRSIQPTFLFLTFKGIDMKRQIALNTDSGAFFTSLNVKGIKKLNVVRPPHKIEIRFENIVKPIRNKREINNFENQKLSDLRDWLL
ncbi:MAG: restriction endonuclease subunit S, partial [Ignavibacteria bacterium]